MGTRLLIFDDDPQQLAILRDMVESCSEARRLEVDTVSDKDALAEIISTGSADILLIDVSIDGAEENGIDLVRRYGGTDTCAQVIYVTGYDSFHAQAYRTGHVGFLTKPVSMAELEEALGRAIARLSEASESPFWVRTPTGEKVILPRRLRYAESDRRIVRLHVGDEVIETYGKLSELVEQLPARFVQCHKSFVVNMGFIDEFGRSEVTLTTGEKVPVAQKRRSEVRSAFLDFVGRGF